jgi:hypothetical protein
MSFPKRVSFGRAASCSPALERDRPGARAVTGRAAQREPSRWRGYPCERLDSGWMAGTIQKPEKEALTSWEGHIPPQLAIAPHLFGLDPSTQGRQNGPSLFEFAPVKG